MGVGHERQTFRRHQPFSASAIRRDSSSGVTPRIKNRFCGDVSPAINSICDLRSDSDLAQQLDDRLVRLALLGRLGDADLEHAVLLAADLVATSARLGTHRQDRSLGVRLQVDHAISPSNNAEPTRTIVAPSSIATS